MKRFLKLLQPHLTRPILYSALLKLTIGLCAVLLWERYLANGRELQQAIFFAAFYFLLWTWFQYLAFDGMRPFVPSEEEPKASASGFRLKDLINTKIDAFEELEDDEKTVCRLCADAIAAVCFFLAYVIFAL